MIWILFEGQLLNLSEFVRFFAKGNKVYGETSIGKKILLARYECETFLRESMNYLMEKIEKINGHREGQKD